MSPSRRYLLAFLLSVLFGTATAADYQLAGRVVRVIDGDSLVLDVRGSQYEVELDGIDAPELDQPWGAAAADRLYASLTGVFVVVNASGSGYWIRGNLVVRDRDVALDMLSEGLAWSTIPADPQQPFSDPYNEAQNRAQTQRRGLWSDDNPIPPWAWRAGFTHSAQPQPNETR